MAILHCEDDPAKSREQIGSTRTKNGGLKVPAVSLRKRAA